MIRIIEVRQERGHQVCLVLDGAEDVRIDRRVWEESSCGIGSSLSEEGLEALLARSRRARAKEKALFLLSRRDYSKKELFDRLSRERGRRHPERDEAAAETVQRMEELGLVDRRGDGTLSLAPASGKVDLGSSAILKNLQG